MSSPSSQNSNPSKALIRSFSLLTSFIYFSYGFFKLIILWFWKKCYILIVLYLQEAQNYFKGKVILVRDVILFVLFSDLKNKFMMVV